MSTSKPPKASHAPYTRLPPNDEVIRKRWDHSLEELIFDPRDMSKMTAQLRRPIYISSLEAHVDELHSFMDKFGYSHIMESDLKPFKGLRHKSAKSFLSALQYDISVFKAKISNLDVAISSMEQAQHTSDFEAGYQLYATKQCAP
ncbi:hypothetical protein GALMADRAFT_136170 [Galerina marginata CBS 339.88]|uniref:Uncharacterized protein n=1 Tax=Galerina marginata (strain CBS 339.88) TaxID=685588 RepID=A0A067TD35_GALM3|nr:hypothetical protein GALMADRAFT_136170 [Galerina marginata CBS 339.88]